MSLFFEETAHILSEIQLIKQEFSDVDDHMKLCYVIKKVKKCTAFELYNTNTNHFLFSCCIDNDLSGNFILVKLKESYLRSINELHKMCDRYNSTFIGRITRDFFSLNFEIFDHNNISLGIINFKTSIFNKKPIVFSLKLKSITSEITNFDSPSLECQQSSHNYDIKSTTYTISNPEENFVILETKPPIYNTELFGWLHNLGARVKMASNHNFIVVRNDCNDFNVDNETTTTTTTTTTKQKVIIRHGRTNLSTYILDFRDPVSPLIALATMAATYSNKPFVFT